MCTTYGLADLSGKVLAFDEYPVTAVLDPKLWNSDVQYARLMREIDSDSMV